LSKIVLFVTSKSHIRMASPLELVEQLTWCHQISTCLLKEKLRVRNLIAMTVKENMLNWPRYQNKDFFAGINKLIKT